MGEHLLCKQEVIGSNPLASIGSGRKQIQRVSTLKTEYNPRKTEKQSKRTDCKSDRESSKRTNDLRKGQEKKGAR